MQQSFVTTGGARIGWMNASWPLARLSANQDNLKIAVKILGDYSFTPEQVVSIEKYVLIPVIAWGIRIHHSVADYPQRFIFWTLGNPSKILDGIKQSGFLPIASSSSISPRRGIPIRWPAIIAIIVIWNALFLLNGVQKNPNPLVLAPLLFAFMLSICTPHSTSLQRLILKPNRTVGEIQPLLRLLAFISGLLLIVFSILLACGAFNRHT
jgi:hypothetical protein